MRFIGAVALVCFQVLSYLELSGSAAVVRPSAWLPLQVGAWTGWHGHDRLSHFPGLLRTGSVQSRRTFLTHARRGNQLAHDAVQEGTFIDLLNWLVDNGAELDVHGIALKPLHQTERGVRTASARAVPWSPGLVALRSYARGEKIASLPTALHFSTESIRRLVYYALNARTKRCAGSGSPEGSATFGASNVTDPKILMALALVFFQELLRHEWSPPPHLALHPTTSGHAAKAPWLSRLCVGWLKYLRVLPPPSRTIPLFWTAEELKALEHPVCHAAIARLHRLHSAFTDTESTIRENVSAVLSGAADPQESHALFGRLVTAYATAVCRSIKTPCGQHAFIPVVDLCSHSPRDANASLYFAAHSSGREMPPEQGNAAGKASHGRLQDTKSVHLVATADIAPGEEIQISYGPFDNATLLLNYGLLPDDNPHAMIRMEFSPRRVHAALRSTGVDLMKLTDDFAFLGQEVVRELTKLGLAQGRLGADDAERAPVVEFRPTVTINGDAQPDERLLAAAKVIMGNKDLSALEEGDEPPADGGSPCRPHACLDVYARLSANIQMLKRINIAVESMYVQVNPLRFVVSFIKHFLFEEFSTTAEEDLAILHDGRVTKPGSHLGLEKLEPLTIGMETAIRFRAKRKELLHKAIKQMQQSIRTVQVPDQGEHTPDISFQYRALVACFLVSTAVWNLLPC
ncbi:uncharacterized protein LOC34623843 [Cyclospora cayetanensis]|uniref:Uncharacterized protein LOC34623843 n=1 Tax=Cyclospora cayetanensis TaxID=88456 RepID=A0A6P6RRM4_9EIME|nr:uncharacterized protein LOC34623843 [Cyclospora cayetanensis]